MLTLRAELPYRPPLAWAPLLAFLGARAIPGVERVDGDAYQRVVEAAGGPCIVDVRPHPRRQVLELRTSIPPGPDLDAAVRQARRVFDLDADPAVIATHFAADRLLGARVRRLPGLRVPGAWDPFELGIRAILGQQVTVKGASTLAGQLVARCGLSAPLAEGLTHAFPRPQDLAADSLETLGMPERRRVSLRAFAGAVASRRVSWDAAELGAVLDDLPGIGDWTVQYILMRGCHDPDAFPVSDLWLRRAAGAASDRELLARAERWRPWRAYAAMYLWQAP